MKRKSLKLSLIITLIMLLVCCISLKSNAADVAHFTMNNVSGEVGQTVKVELKAQTELKLEDTSIKISFDNKKLSISNGNITVGDAFTKYFYDYNVTDSGEIRFGVASSDEFTVPAGTTILTMNFKILENNRYISDGDKNTITVPKDKENEISNSYKLPIKTY